MSFLYHIIPEDMQGNILFPLNTLRRIHPEIYEQEIKKYDARKFLPDRIVPILNCLWNDVLHLTAIHPCAIRDVLEDIGFNPPETTWFEINPFDLTTIIEPRPAVFYHDSVKDKLLSQNDFERYDPDKISEYTRLPNATKQYYRESFERGVKPLLFAGTTHILFKGNLNVSDATIIED